MEPASDATESFTIFMKEIEPQLRHALVAVFGQEHGREATAEALTYAWEHWHRVGAMENPAGYLYRVGRSRRPRSEVPLFAPVPTHRLPEVEPGLPAALGSLSEKQRVAVVMVHAYGWTRHEAASLLDVTISTLDTHLLRGVAKLRNALGVEAHA